MSPHDTALEQNEYRLVLVKSGSQMIWAVRRGHGFRLPRILIPRWTRPAELLQEEVESAWHLHTIVLDFLPGKNGGVPCAVMEILSPELHNGEAAVSFDEIAYGEITIEEREVIKAILAGSVGLRGPFSRVGWIQEAMRWLQAEVDHGIVFTGEIRQYNAGGTFALVRFGTRQGTDYWLKATGKPNGHEFTVTTALSKLFTQHLPPVVAAREDWNAWVMEDAGEPLRDLFTFPALELAVGSLAELQMRSVCHIQDLLIAGCFDQRFAVLKGRLGELICYLEDAMASQTSTKVPRLNNRRLHELGNMVNDAFSRMEEFRIPDALIHGDINSGNILFDGSRCVFTDWAEAHIGNPFSTFQQLYEQVASDERSRNWCTSLRALYWQQWRTLLSEPQIKCAAALAPFLAIVSYLYGRGSWLTSPHRADLRFQSYSRSLARHLDRAAQNPGLQEALCR